ncbi:MAG: S8 family serine peptidase [Synechococcales bacterium]|nr:S8 family serine peptidase [Synechococcales bacterium]
MVGQVTSQGDRALQADVARQLFNIDGSGIKIGIISDSFNAFRSTDEDIASGDLPGEDNPNGFTQPVQILQDLPRFFGIDEGRAMAQIIHDIAPGAELLFHTVVDRDQLRVSDETFATAVNALADAGADIIVDDVGFSTTLFQDGLAAQTVDAVTQRGIVYISSAGNDGFGRSYESPFRLGETFSFRGVEYDAHDFDPAEGVDLFQEIRLSNFESFNIQFTWEEAIGQVNSDFQLYLLDQPVLPGMGSQILASSVISDRSVTDAPLVDLFYSQFQGREDEVQSFYLLIARKEGSAPDTGLIKWANTANGEQGNAVYEYVNDSPGAVGAGTVYGHPNAAGAIAVGAANFNRTPEFGIDPVISEAFSSTGAAPILFDAAGNPLATPELREKPDIIGPNRVSTTLPFFRRFAGTSAAAPHIAGVVALMLQRAGGSGSLTPDQVRTILQATDIPVAPRTNLPADAGFAQADGAVLQSIGFNHLGTAGNDQIAGLGRAENLHGLAGNDVLRGGGGLDALFGGEGDDQLVGGDNNDYLAGERGDDLLRGGGGDDTLRGGGQTDRLLGGKGNDVLLGDRSSDTLIGGGGDDILSGGQGRNDLKGGGGADVFWVDTTGRAMVRDFEDGQDRLAFLEPLAFEDLELNQRGRHLVIRSADGGQVTLMGVEAAMITAEDILQEPPAVAALLA